MRSMVEGAQRPRQVPASAPRTRGRGPSTAFHAVPLPVPGRNLVSDPLRALLNAAAVRERAHEMLDAALAGGVEGWSVDLDRLEAAAALTAAVTREAYPDLDIPFHARW